MSKRKRASQRKAQPTGEVSLPGPQGKVTLGDLGLNTPAAKNLAVVESAIDGENPNKVMRVRRISWIEKYHKDGTISRRALDAAIKLQGAYEGTQRRPPAIKEINVDSTSKPDVNVAIMIDRQSKYHSVAKHIPAQWRELISHVVLDNLPIRVKGRMRARYAGHLDTGLNKLADALKI